MVKHLSTMQETRVQSVGREDLLEKEMATHSGVLAWKIPRTEEPGRLPSTGLQRVGHDLVTEQPPPPLDHQGSPALVHFYKHLSQLYTTL